MESVPTVGLFTDCSPQAQPDGTYRFALNMLLDNSEGGKGAICTEHSNRLLSELPTLMCGFIGMSSTEAIIFCQPGYIYLLDNGALTLLYEDAKFNFSRSHPIRGVYRVINGCERTVYWQDGVNPDRFYNLDKTDDFTSINDFRISPLVGRPLVTSEELVGGGELEYGSYYFVLEVMDESQNVILRSTPSAEIRIGSALNIDSSTADVGGKPPINNSIKLSISNLSTQFSYIRIGVLKYTSGDGITPTAHYVSDLLPITTSSINYIYRGQRTSDVDTIADELLTAIDIYDASGAMVSVHNKLLRGRLKKLTNNYNDYQRYASKIASKYIVDERMDTVSKSEQGDEIRDYGIVYIHDTGVLSPVFHIPGPTPSSTDLQTVIDPVTGNSRPRWSVYNTATKDNVPISGYASSGTPGYYQGDSTYANPDSFCNDDYWGEDSEGNLLIDTPVRHHRIPCRSLEPLMSSDYTKKRYIGMRFTNVEYPNDRIVDHFFVCSVLDSTTETVVDAGYMIPYNYEPDDTGDKKEGRIVHYLPNSDNNEAQSNVTTQIFLGSTPLVNERPVQASRVKINGYLGSVHEQNKPKIKKFFKDDQHLQLFGKHHNCTSYTVAEEHIGIDESYYLPSKTITLEYPNRSLTHDFNILLLDNQPTTFNVNRANFNYTYTKIDVNPFAGLHTIRYRKYGNTYTSLSTNYDIFDGDRFISKLDVTNLSYVYASGGASLFNLFFGLVGYAVAELLTRDQVNIEYEWIQNLYLESKYDLDRRHEGTDLCNTYMEDSKEIDTFIINKTCLRVDVDNDKKWTIRDSLCPEWYGYNYDYTPISDRLIFYALPFTHNFCSSCVGEFSGRIQFSETTSQEGIEDSWRVFKPLSYTDIPATRGAIIAMDYVGNRLVVRCETGVFVLDPDPKRFQADGTNIFLGTGAFLSLPPSEVGNAVSGYGGQQSVLGSVRTPYGLVWADQNSGMIFHFDGQLHPPISRNGMYHYFENHLPSKLKDAFPTVYDEGYYGIVMTYDPKFERIILHKPDFLSNNDQVTFNGTNFKRDVFTISNGNQAQVQNHGFTISYSFQSRTWISWHSYQPNYMFFLGRNFYTVRANNIYKHDRYTTSGNYYGLQFSNGIELQTVSGETFQNRAFHYYAVVQEFNEQVGMWEDVFDTFDTALMFNQSQSTGFVTLNLSDDAEDVIDWSTTVKRVAGDDHNYHIADLKDISDGQTLKTTTWVNRSAFYQDDQGYIDWVPVNIDYNKPIHEQEPFVDKVTQLRLFFKNSNRRLLLYLEFWRNFPY